MTLDEEIQSAFSSAAAVVKAEAIEVTEDEYVPTPNNPPPLSREQRVTWQVSRVWKGSYASNSLIKSVTEVQCCICGVAVKKGAVYVLFLDDQMPFWLSICSNSKPVEQAAPDMALLDRLSQ
jgi:hypothetical protein